MSLEDELVHFARDQMRISEHYVAKCLSIWETVYGRKVVEAVRARLPVATAVQSYISEDD